MYCPEKKRLGRGVVMKLSDENIAAALQLADRYDSVSASPSFVSALCREVLAARRMRDELSMAWGTGDFDDCYYLEKCKVYLIEEYDKARSGE